MDTMARASTLIGAALLASIVRVGAVGFSASCVPSYPIDSSTLLWDFDANCNWMCSTATVWLNSSWGSKAGSANLVIGNTTMPCAARTLDTTRGLYRLVISAGRKLRIPYNIGPTANPNGITIEYLVSVGSVATNSFKAVWSADAGTAITSGTVHGRTLLAYGE